MFVVETYLALKIRLIQSTLLKGVHKELVTAHCHFQPSKALWYSYIQPVLI